MRNIRSIASAMLALLLAGCAQLGLKSLPWPTNVAIHDTEAVDHLRGVPAIDATLGDGLTTKPMLDDGRLVGLSISGGGARAAAFTLGVLTELQALTTPDGSTALDRIDFISSNSGGSWGAAAYVADRAASEGPYRLSERVPEALMPAFVAMSRGRVGCWERSMQEHLFKRRTYGQVYSPAKGRELPALFFNAALLPAHSPFVFNDAFIGYFQVERFGACRSDWALPARRIADVPFGFGAAASGTVPGFYHAFAETSLCARGPFRSASFCHAQQKGGPRSYLRIADGGLYDNIGYKTAYEIMLSQQAAAAQARKAMILVNSNTSTDLKTTTPGERDASFLATTAKSGLFAVQDSTFERLYAPMFKSLGVAKPILLDYYSTAKFRPDQAALLDGLDALAFYAAHNVSCFDGDLFKPAKPRELPATLPPASESFAKLAEKPGDCRSENFYRAGTLGKTTYLADPVMFTILWQLGRLSVRMNRDEILAAVR